MFILPRVAIHRGCLYFYVHLGLVIARDAVYVEYFPFCVYVVYWRLVIADSHVFKNAAECVGKQVKERGLCPLTGKKTPSSLGGRISGNPSENSIVTPRSVVVILLFYYVSAKITI
jgi:hypothetical protein